MTPDDRAMEEKLTAAGGCLEDFTVDMTSRETLEAAIEETREELTGFLREETARQAARSRITTALCLAGACLVILVLI